MYVVFEPFLFDIIVIIGKSTIIQKSGLIKLFMQFIQLAICFFDATSQSRKLSYLT